MFRKITSKVNCDAKMKDTKLESPFFLRKMKDKRSSRIFFDEAAKVVSILALRLSLGQADSCNCLSWLEGFQFNFVLMCECVHHWNMARALSSSDFMPKEPVLFY